MLQIFFDSIDLQHVHVDIIKKYDSRAKVRNSYLFTIFEYPFQGDQSNNVNIIDNINVTEFLGDL